MGKKSQATKKWILDTLKEKTTWLGLFGILTAFALLPFDESTTMYLATILSSLGGLIGYLCTVKEKPAKRRVSKRHCARFDDSTC